MARLGDTYLTVGRSLKLPLAEVELKTSRSSGPGGQHANTSDTRVEAVFNVAASESLSDAQRERVVKNLGTVVRAVSQDARSQLRNRELALIRLGDKLEQALKVRRSRVATKPSRAAKAQRVKEKRARGEVKSARRRPEMGE